MRSHSLQQSSQHAQAVCLLLLANVCSVELPLGSCLHSCSVELQWRAQLLAEAEHVTRASLQQNGLAGMITRFADLCCLPLHSISGSVAWLTAALTVAAAAAGSGGTRASQALSGNWKMARPNSR